jgi:glycosyltransferase involved in cell wall biosynthesis
LPEGISSVKNTHMSKKKVYKICLIGSQIAGFGKIGGFGSMTRRLAIELTVEGHKVSVIVPKRKNQNAVEKIGKVTVYGITATNIFGLSKLLKKIDADIYHSQNPNLLSLAAQILEPTKKHVITCRDPKRTKDWLTELKYATWKRRLKTPLVYLFEGGPAITEAIKRADFVGTPANYLKVKVGKMYGRKNVGLLPNIETIASRIPTKSKQPTVCYVGRLDKRKSPETIILLAKKFPRVQFIIVGKAEDDDRQLALESLAKGLRNLRMTGYLSKEEGKLETIYSESWIFINTAYREGLPMTFVEAAGHGCAILSQVNPDQFASQFGYRVRRRNFEDGLRALLKNKSWQNQGKKGYQYVKKTYDRKNSLKAHEDIYTALMEKS